MKKVITLMLGLVATTASFAQQVTSQTGPTPTASIAQTRLIATADQKIKLFVQPQPTKGQIMLRDAEGHSLYSATVALQNGLGQQFDVSSLAVGTYKLIVTTGSGTVTKTFVVQPVPNETFVVVPS